MRVGEVSGGVSEGGEVSGGVRVGEVSGGVSEGGEVSGGVSEGWRGEWRGK